jgi:hypothetical protein
MLEGAAGHPDHTQPSKAALCPPGMVQTTTLAHVVVAALTLGHPVCWPAPSSWALQQEQLTGQCMGTVMRST